MPHRAASRGRLFLIFHMYSLLLETALLVQIQWKWLFIIFPLHFSFFLSQLHTAAENKQHQMLVLLPMASALWIALSEEFLMILGISAVMHRNTRDSIQGIFWFWEDRWVFSLSYRYRLYRHLMNKMLPLSKGGSQNSWGDSWNQVLASCEGIIRCVGLMRLRICSSSMLPAL